MLNVDSALVRRLVASQFPQWKDLAIQPVAMGGNDNRTFHLGSEMLVRLPSAAAYALKVDKERIWLPKLAPLLPLAIPEPLAMGEPSKEYPWHWSIYRWIEGETAAVAHINDLEDFALRLAQFLKSLHIIETTDGPLPGTHNFFRGGNLTTYDSETRQAIKALAGKINTNALTRLWEDALRTTWSHSPVWVHGDISLGNLLVKNGKLSAVIDFGGLAIGDPACDLVIAWTFFHGRSRKTFMKMLPLDQGTWQRARGWALWKALIVSAEFVTTNAVEGAHSWRTIEEVLTDS